MTTFRGRCAAEAMATQAEDLNDAVAFFNLGTHDKTSQEKNVTKVPVMYGGRGNGGPERLPRQNPASTKSLPPQQAAEPEKDDSDWREF